MMSEKQNPDAVERAGAPNSNFADSKCGSENATPLRDFQALHIARRTPVGVEMASVLAPILFWEAAR